MLVSASSRAGQLLHLPVPAWKPVAASLSVSSLTLFLQFCPFLYKTGRGWGDCPTAFPADLHSPYFPITSVPEDQLLIHTQDITLTSQNCFFLLLSLPPESGNLVRPHLCHYLIMGSKACIMTASQLALLQNYLKYPVSTRSHSLVSG